MATHVNKSPIIFALDARKHWALAKVWPKLTPWRGMGRGSGGAQNVQNTAIYGDYFEIGFHSSDRRRYSASLLTIIRSSWPVMYVRYWQWSALSGQLIPLKQYKTPSAKESMCIKQSLQISAMASICKTIICILRLHIQRQPFTWPLVVTHTSFLDKEG